MRGMNPHLHLTCRVLIWMIQPRVDRWHPTLCTWTGKPTESGGRPVPMSFGVPEKVGGHTVIRFSAVQSRCVLGLTRWATWATTDTGCTTNRPELNPRGSPNRAGLQPAKAVMTASGLRQRVHNRPVPNPCGSPNRARIRQSTVPFREPPIDVAGPDCVIVTEA